MLGHFYVFMSACMIWERWLHRVFDILVCLLLSMILMSHDATAGDSLTGTDTTMETRYLRNTCALSVARNFLRMILCPHVVAILTQQETIARALTNRRVGRMAGASGTTVVGLTMGLGL